MRKIATIAAVVSMVISGAALATGNVSVGSVSSGAYIAPGAQGVAKSWSNLELGSRTNTDAYGYTSCSRGGVVSHVNGISSSYFNGNAGSYVAGSTGLAAASEFSGSTHAEAYHSNYQSTLFGGDYPFDYEAAKTSIHLGSGLSGDGWTGAENVYSPGVTGTKIVVEGNTHVLGEADANTKYNRETYTNVDFAGRDGSTTYLNVEKYRWGNQYDAGDYRVGTIRGDSWGRGSAQAWD